MMLLELQMDSLFRETLSFQSLSTMRSGFGRSGTIKWVCICLDYGSGRLCPACIHRNVKEDGIF